MIPDEEQPAAGIGHNLPPSPIEQLKAEQAPVLAKYEKRRDEIIESATKKLVTDRISAGQAGDILKIGRQVFDRVDAERKDVAEPFRTAITAAAGAFDEFWTPARDALTELKRRLDAWGDAEDKRIEDQRLEQKRAEDAMRASAARLAAPDGVPSYASAPAPAPASGPAKRSKIRGDLGATVTRVDDKVYRVVDVRAVPDWILNTSTVHDAIIAVAKSHRKHNPIIPGIETDTVGKNQIR